MKLHYSVDSLSARQQINFPLFLGIEYRFHFQSNYSIGKKRMLAYPGLAHNARLFSLLLPVLNPCVRDGKAYIHPSLCITYIKRAFPLWRDKPPLNLLSTRQTSITLSYWTLELYSFRAADVCCLGNTLLFTFRLYCMDDSFFWS